MYLDSHKVTITLESLMKRIEDRFPHSGLYKLCSQLHDVARETEMTVDKISRPIWSIRLAAILLIIAFIVTLVVILAEHTMSSDTTFYNLVQTMDAGGNLLILVGLAVVFLWSLEVKRRRKRVVEALNTLRDVAHIIDMKQLTKDPAGTAKVTVPTKNSPKRELCPFMLGRYLDYCSEMLALVSKLGYLYAAKFHDTESTRAVNELENLTTALSRKIWQKIMILNSETTNTIAHGNNDTQQ